MIFRSPDSPLRDRKIRENAAEKSAAFFFGGYEEQKSRLCERQAAGLARACCSDSENKEQADPTASAMD